ncbi:hypothetical protein PYW07_014796 [Mythimna separata]|uniref:Uncharacterized protein n=1 Tax=Mythimna separata TaxID=271217 RepID=A0AAD8DZB1_MYTSE|nr:hypothetical protein PYW07_014796 [Mythimna separata]
MKFGLFLVDTNLRQFLERKRPKMISGIRPRLEKLLDKLDEVAQYYSSMIEKHKDDPKIIPNIKLALLFHDTWPENPDTFHTAMLNRTRILPVDQLKSIYDTFENYKFRVYDFEENRPTSGESDECIALLVQSGISQFISRTQPTCAMNARCKRVILGENQFGYGLTHRLLLLAVARFKERCVVFSPKMDRYKSDTFCKLCYNEADYIATNSFGMPDLMFEQISICGLFGHAQFLRNHWLNTLRKFQTTAGCFSERLATGGFEANKLREDVNKEWMLDRPTDIIHGECNIHFTPKQLSIIFGKWDSYYSNVNDFEKNFPSPKDSDACLTYLVQTPHLYTNGRSQLSCLTPPKCRLMIEEGSDFGYALTHRLLYLIVARFSRRCVVFSEMEDKLKTDMFCKKCFYEAEYIASNGFRYPDLMFEQIGLCGLLGHAQFIRNYWLKTLLKFQTPEGCFPGKASEEVEDQMKEDEDEEWKIDRKLDIMNGQCNVHFSSVAVATLSNALRFIMETYY